MIQKSKVADRKKNSTPEVRGNERFFYTKIFFIFDFGYFLEKWLQRHLEAKQFQNKFGFWSTQKCSKVSKHVLLVQWLIFRVSYMCRANSVLHLLHRKFFCFCFVVMGALCMMEVSMLDSMIKVMDVGW